MSIVNRRNAVLGWTVWQVMKGMAKQKAKSAVPKVDAPRRRLSRAAIVGGLAAAGTVVFFWLRNGSADDLPPAV
jgi:hypothetical protein